MRLRLYYNIVATVRRGHFKTYKYYIVVISVRMNIYNSETIIASYTKFDDNMSYSYTQL